MATLTVEYFKKNYASLKDVSDDDVNRVLDKLKEDCITTTTSLEIVSRDGLIQKNYPAVFVKAVKPDTQLQQAKVQRDEEPQQRWYYVKNLHKNLPAGRWTINGSDVKILYPLDRRISTLLAESTDDDEEGPVDLVTAIPLVNYISECWSYSEQHPLSVEVAEVLEKCLLWN